MILPFDYIGYKRLSENKHFPNHRWYSDATWGGMGEGSPLLFKSYFEFNYHGTIIVNKLYKLQPLDLFNTYYRMKCEFVLVL